MGRVSPGGDDMEDLRQMREAQGMCRPNLTQI